MYRFSSRCFVFYCIFLPRAIHICLSQISNSWYHILCVDLISEFFHQNKSSVFRRKITTKWIKKSNLGRQSNWGVNILRNSACIISDLNILWNVQPHCNFSWKFSRFSFHRICSSDSPKQRKRNIKNQKKNNKTMMKNNKTMKKNKTTKKNKTMKRRKTFRNLRRTSNSSFLFPTNTSKPRTKDVRWSPSMIRCY